MANEERQGILERLTDRGIVLDGARLSYSKWFEGEPLVESALGCRIRVLVDAGEKCTFVKRVLEIGQKVPGWTPPAAGPSGPWGGGGRRISPEELDLKKSEGPRIARSVALDRAITILEKKIPLGEIFSTARTLEEYILTGKPPQAAEPEEKAPKDPPSVAASPEKPVRNPSTAPAASPPTRRMRRPSNASVNDLFNEARRAGVVADWHAFDQLVSGIVGRDAKSPYHLSLEEFAKVEAAVHARPRRTHVA